MSVVIPCYRQAHFLPEAIESVLAQTCRDVEIIVVDDGSPDDAAAVAARYPGVRCVRQRNMGLSAARNAGLAHARGTYVAFLDADDRLTPRALAIGTRELSAHPECAFVSGELCWIGDEGIVWPRPREPVTEEHYRELLKQCFIWCPATVLYRRSVFHTVGGFDTSLRSAEDYDMYLRIAGVFPVRTHGEIVAEYRLHSSSMSRNLARMLKSTITVLRTQRHRVRGNPELEAAYFSGIDMFQSYYGIPLIRQIGENLSRRRWKDVLSDSLVALQFHPRAFARHVYGRLRRTIAAALS